MARVKLSVAFAIGLSYAGLLNGQAIAPRCEDPTRQVFFEQEGVGLGGCRDEPGFPCESGWVLVGLGGPFQIPTSGLQVAASCFVNALDNCVPCTAFEEALGNCVNTCGQVALCNDPTRTNFLGGPAAQACSEFHGDPDSCLTAWHLGQFGSSTCRYDFVKNQCNGCGPVAESRGDCINSCRPCVSKVTSINGLRDEVSSLNADSKTASILNKILNDAQANLDQAKNDKARSSLEAFIAETVKLSGTSQKIPLAEASSLICGASNVLTGIPMP